MNWNNERTEAGVNVDDDDDVSGGGGGCGSGCGGGGGVDDNDVPLLANGVADIDAVDIALECSPVITYNEQSNKTRYIYTLTEYAPESGKPSCHLINDLYISKASRSDERVVITESSMVAMVRTLLFMYVFQTLPEESMYDIVYSGEVNHNLNKKRRAIEDLTLSEFVRELDNFFGKNFSKVVRRPVTLVYYEYLSKIRYFNYGENVKSPSAEDYVDLYRFIKSPVSNLTPLTEFVLSFDNSDYKTPLQQRIKYCF